MCDVSLQGITKETLPAYMSPHVDVVSMGALTQGTKQQHRVVHATLFVTPNHW